MYTALTSSQMFFLCMVSALLVAGAEVLIRKVKTKQRIQRERDQKWTNLNRLKRSW